MRDRAIRQHAYFAMFVFGSALIFLKPVENVIRFALSRDYGTHIFLVLPISLYLIFLSRDEVFSSTRPGLTVGVPLLIFSTFLAWVAITGAVFTRAQLSFEIFSLVLIWISAFIL